MCEIVKCYFLSYHKSFGAKNQSKKVDSRWGLKLVIYPSVVEKALPVSCLSLASRFAVSTQPLSSSYSLYRTSSQSYIIMNTAAFRVISRIGSRRQMSDAPRMHKAKDAWKDMVATRPVDPHPHVSIFSVRL